MEVYGGKKYDYLFGHASLGTQNRHSKLALRIAYYYSNKRLLMVANVHHICIALF